MSLLAKTAMQMKLPKRKNEIRMKLVCMQDCYQVFLF